MIVAEVDRLYWRIWSGKVKDAGIALERIRGVMPGFQDEAGGRKTDPLSCWPESGHIDHGSNHQRSDQPPHERISADARVRRSAGPCFKLAVPFSTAISGQFDSNLAQLFDATSDFEAAMAD